MHDLHAAIASLREALFSLEEEAPPNLVATDQLITIAQHHLHALINTRCTELIALAKANGQVQVIKPRPRAKPSAPKAPRRARGIFAQLEEEMPG